MTLRSWLQERLLKYEPLRIDETPLKGQKLIALIEEFKENHEFVRAYHGGANLFLAFADKESDFTSLSKWTPLTDDNVKLMRPTDDWELDTTFNSELITILVLKRKS